MREKVRLWLVRGLIALVTTWNLQAALVFILRPERFAPGFELTGEPGATAVRGTGILFLMWNVPYLVALWHPVKYRLALGIALIMQLIGVLGESWTLYSLQFEHTLLKISIWRFIGFDSVGLLLLAVAFWLVRRDVKSKSLIE